MGLVVIYGAYRTLSHYFSPVGRLRSNFDSFADRGPAFSVKLNLSQSKSKSKTDYRSADFTGKVFKEVKV